MLNNAQPTKCYHIREYTKGKVSCYQARCSTERTFCFVCINKYIELITRVCLGMVSYIKYKH